MLFHLKNTVFAGCVKEFSKKTKKNKKEFKTELFFIMPATGIEPVAREFDTCFTTS